MLIPRVYKPKAKDILYHYCDANAFISICTNSKMRLSDVYSMNDFLEMHWGYGIWEEVATDLIKDLGEEFIDNVDKHIHLSGAYGTLTACCFSLDGDVLSQWRAYADDGKGYVIGFKARDLIELPIRPLKVQYNKKKQIQELKTVIRTLHSVEETEPLKFGPDFERVCTGIAFDLAAFKNPAFVEEKEVRLVHVLSFEPSNGRLKLVDDGGTAFSKSAVRQPILFRARESVPVPYIELDFSDVGRINPIKEVIVGPKNPVLTSAVSVFLETVGVGSVSVKRSNASYR
jgi:hypothetical protein